MAPFQRAAQLAGECVYNNLYWHNSWLHGWRLDFKATEVGNIALSKLSLCVSLFLLLPLPLSPFLRGSFVCVRERAINHYICYMTIFPYNRLLHIHTNIDLFCRGHACHVRTHMNALESTDACRWKENTSCLISKAQQSIFFPWHLRRLDTTQPIPAQFFWGSNGKRPGIQSGSASSCFQGQTAAPCLHCWLLSRSLAVSCSPSRSCTTPGAKKRAGKIASNQAHPGNYLLQKKKRKLYTGWKKCTAT